VLGLESCLPEQLYAFGKSWRLWPFAAKEHGFSIGNWWTGPKMVRSIVEVGACL
jgi:hypothetical protein